MNIEETLNRSFNLLAVTVVGLAGFAFAAEIINETEWAFKIDDILLLLLGLGAIAWYFKNWSKRSIAPVIFIVIAMVIKAVAIYLEIKDVEDVGDDFGGLTLFVLATGLVIYQYSKTKKLLAAAGTSAPLK